MEQSPLVSIIMATYNRCSLIGDAIQSVLNQTYSNWELIIADDGSTDATSDIVTSWAQQDSRIRYSPIPHAGRISIVSNAALRAARGRYVAILDDDDLWIDPRKLEKQVAYMEMHPNCVACGAGYRITNAVGDVIEDIYKPESDAHIRHVALRANPIANSTALFRRDCGEFYDPNLRQFADWDFWLRLGLHGNLYNFPELFLAYRIWNHGSSFVNQRANSVAAIRIVQRYRTQYPGYGKAILMARTYWLYTLLPTPVRRQFNSSLSRLKKRIFAKTN